MQSKKQNKAYGSFKRDIWRFYREHKRSFPWRETTDPYKILVSEIMLQQTQTDRVVPKYNAFLSRFPTCKKLANAPLGEVLKLWSGLGYNRRARYLHESAKTVVNEFNGAIPDCVDGLKSLPGIGEYTANAIMAFAFNKPACCIETNIRSVFTHYFFQRKKSVNDSEIRTLILETLPRLEIRDWYYALMDRGAALKKTEPLLNKKSAHYVKQSRFKGSRREVRGAILLTLAKGQPLSPAALSKNFKRSKEEISDIISTLLREKLIKKSGKRLTLP